MCQCFTKNCDSRTPKECGSWNEQTVWELSLLFLLFRLLKSLIFLAFAGKTNKLTYLWGLQFTWYQHEKFSCQPWRFQRHEIRNPFSLIFVGFLQLEILVLYLIGRNKNILDFVSIDSWMEGKWPVDFRRLVHQLQQYIGGICATVCNNCSRLLFQKTSMESSFLAFSLKVFKTIKQKFWIPNITFFLNFNSFKGKTWQKLNQFNHEKWNKATFRKQKDII